MTDQQLLELPRYRESDAFNDEERLVIEYAELMTRTPVEVPEAFFAKLRERFSSTQLVELSAAIAWENYRARFNHAFGLESEGMDTATSCALPQRAPAALPPAAT